MGFSPANFQLASACKVFPSVLDLGSGTGKQTDKQTDRQRSSLDNAPTLRGRGHKNSWNRKRRVLSEVAHQFKAEQ